MIMKLKNTNENFGSISIMLHWLMALLIIGLFILGKYMMSLDYYDPFYHTGPWWHKSFGLIIAGLLIARLLWKFSNPKVMPLSNHKKHEIVAAKLVKFMLYILILICCISGYMISTAEGAGVEFFDVFKVPALISKGSEQADIAGEIHEISTLGLIILAGLHMLAALKHHFIDKDKTLIRILKTKP